MVAAFRLKEAIVLEVPNTVILIPTTGDSKESATIGNKAVDIGSYVYLTENTWIEGGFDYLAAIRVSETENNRPENHFPTR
jgi:hypothetical protein